MIIKAPENEDEFRSMWQLNCDVFCRELGLHPVPDDGMLVDRFHGINSYRIAWDGKRVCAMIAAHTEAPFSVVNHFGTIMEREIVPGKTCEIRLFCLMPKFRNTLLSARLTSVLFEDMRKLKVGKLVISGVESQVNLYRHIGFEVVGEPVKDGQVWLFPLTGDITVVLGKLSRVFNTCKNNTNY